MPIHEALKPKGANFSNGSLAPALRISTSSVATGIGSTIQLTPPALRNFHVVVSVMSMRQGNNLTGQKIDNLILEIAMGDFYMLKSVEQKRSQRFE